MQRSQVYRFWLGVGLLAGAGYALRHVRRLHATTVSAQATYAYELLTRAAPLIRLPTAPDQPPEVLADGSGVRCPISGRIFPYQNGVLNLLIASPALTVTQHTLNTPFTAWAYDRFRGALLRLAGAPDFPHEFAATQALLNVQQGDMVLDLACGHGNFTVAWAQQAGPEGLVIGLDISPAMLARAAVRVQASGVRNVLLVRGDAHRLPFADESLAKVNCSGGFHQLPALPQALCEIARISQPGAMLTASTFGEQPGDPQRSFKGWLRQRFGLHFVPLVQLGEQLAALGYSDYGWSLPGGWFGYTAARKTM